MDFEKEGGIPVERETYAVGEQINLKLEEFIREGVSTGELKDGQPILQTVFLEMRSKKKWALLVIGISIYLLKFFSYKKAVSGLTYSDTLIESIEDGTYIGECNVDFIYVKAEVTVLHGAITEIELLEHKQERGASEEKIVDNTLMP